MRAQIVGLCALLLVGSTTVRAQEEWRPPADIGPSNEVIYAGRGEGINCPDYGSQAAAQAALRADPTDPSNLDTDRNGIACELNPEPRDLVPVPR